MSRCSTLDLAGRVGMADRRYAYGHLAVDLDPATRLPSPDAVIQAAAKIRADLLKMEVPEASFRRARWAARAGDVDDDTAVLVCVVPVPGVDGPATVPPPPPKDPKHG